MTTLATVLVVATLVVAAADWWAVSADRRSLEYLLKPLTMVVLIAAVLAMEPTSDDARLFIVAGLVCSLAGDVFLMLDEKFFLGGLVSFLVGHVMYVIALLQFDVEPPLLFVGVLLVLVAAAVIGSKVVAGARGQDERLTVPVAVYMSVISLMVVSAFGTTIPIAIAGALLFYASDGVLGWNRFVQPVPHGRLVIMTTYHLGQIGLALALVA
jgi:alkenylglycerophosphocholine/alkenylglycerophosphoethanolamine hydrolase